VDADRQRRPSGAYGPARVGSANCPGLPVLCDRQIRANARNDATPRVSLSAITSGRGAPRGRTIGPAVPTERCGPSPSCGSSDEIPVGRRNSVPADISCRFVQSSADDITFLASQGVAPKKLRRVPGLML